MHAVHNVARYQQIARAIEGVTGSVAKGMVRGAALSNITWNFVSVVDCPPQAVITLISATNQKRVCFFIVYNFFYLQI